MVIIKYKITELLLQKIGELNLLAKVETLTELKSYLMNLKVP